MNWAIRFVQRSVDSVSIRLLGVGLPRMIKRWWYCGQWMTFREDLNSQKQEARSDYVEYPVEGKFMFNPFQTILQGQKKDLVDGLIPGFRLGNRIGLYEQIGGAYYSRGTGSHSDWAMWDDGKKIDLRLARVITVEEFEKVFPPRLRAPIKISVDDRLPDDDRTVYIWFNFQTHKDDKAHDGRYEGEQWHEIRGLASKEIPPDVIPVKGSTHYRIVFWAEREGFESS